MKNPEKISGALLDRINKLNEKMIMK